MSQRKRRKSDQAGRPPMRSPGKPPTGRREHRVRFWTAVARGMSSERAAVEAGVAAVIGVRWFREGGGMPSVTVAPLSGRYLSFASGRRSRCCVPVGMAFVRLHVGSVGRRRRSLASCAVTPRLVVVVSRIGPALRSGTRTDVGSVRSRPSWLSMLSCGGICRTVSPGQWSTPTAS